MLNAAQVAYLRHTTFLIDFSTKLLLLRSNDSCFCKVPNSCSLKPDAIVAAITGNVIKLRIPSSHNKVSFALSELCPYCLYTRDCIPGYCLPVFAPPLQLRRHAVRPCGGGTPATVGEVAHPISACPRQAHSRAMRDSPRTLKLLLYCTKRVRPPLVESGDSFTSSSRERCAELSRHVIAKLISDRVE